MARRPYTTRVRPFRDSGETVKIRWYPARPEDGTLPYTSRICSLDWVTRPEEAEGVGEVFGESRNYNRAKAIPGPKRTHVCGHRHDHQFGGIYDPTRQPMQYQPSGLPLCCEPGRREVEVKAVAAPVSVAYTNPVYRSSVTTVAVPASYVIPNVVRRSTVCVCPAAVYSHTLRSDPFYSDVLLAVEPESDAGTAGVYRSEVPVWVRPQSVATTEGSTICPVIAPSCGAIGNASLNHSCAYEIKSPVSLNGWFRWLVVPGSDYEVRLTWYPPGSGGSGTWRVWHGANCGSLTLIAFGDGAGLPVGIPFTAAAAYVYLELVAMLPPPGSTAFDCGVFDVP